MLLEELPQGVHAWDHGGADRGAGVTDHYGTNGETDNGTTDNSRSDESSNAQAHGFAFE